MISPQLDLHLSYGDAKVPMIRALSTAFPIYKKGIGYFLGFMLLIFIGSVFINGIARLAPMLSFIFSLGFNLFLAPALLSGYFFASHEIDRKGSTSFDRLFAGFSNGRYPTILGLGLVCAIITFVLMLALIWGVFGDAINASRNPYGHSFGYEQNNPLGKIILTFLGIMALILVNAFYLFSVAAVAALELGFNEAAKVGMKVFAANWLRLVGFFLLVTLVLGLLSIGIGFLIEDMGRGNEMTMIISIVALFLILIFLVAPYFLVLFYSIFRHAILDFDEPADAAPLEPLLERS